MGSLAVWSRSPTSLRWRLTTLFVGTDIEAFKAKTEQSRGYSCAE
jgi:hypothetical protein